MEYRSLDALRRTHPAWRLLVSPHAPLIVSFLHRAFVEQNIRSWPQAALAARLDDHLHQLRQELGDDVFPKAAARYLDDWASDDSAWLRKYYPASGGDEPHYDITPATEKAIDWLASLRQQRFIGTESRLKLVFDLLRELAEGAETDPAARMAELERRRAAVEDDINRLRDGRLLLMEPSQVKDRFLQMAAMARGLLSDFREVEQNFRTLDRDVRARIAQWEDGKGALLEEIFGQRDAIADSDQGKSFRAFWDFLMSPQRQEELSSLLEGAFALDPVRELAPDRRLLRIHYDWLEAGEVAQRTVARLSEQLRRYLDDQAWLESRRIMQIIRDIEQHALAVRDQWPDDLPMTLDEPGATAALTLDRPLFAPPFKARFSSVAVREGDDDVSADALYNQVFVDKTRLASQIRRSLQTRDQISLAELVRAHPIRQGAAELVAYLGLAAEDRRAMIDDERTQSIGWIGEDGVRREATMPLVIFSRADAGGAPS